MKKKEILSQLENIIESFGVSIRYEDLGTHYGGLCKLFGKMFLFVNKSLPIDAKIELLATELRKFEVDNKFLMPEIRQIILGSKEEH